MLYSYILGGIPVHNTAIPRQPCRQMHTANDKPVDVDHSQEAMAAVATTSIMIVHEGTSRYDRRGEKSSKDDFAFVTLAIQFSFSGFINYKDLYPIHLTGVPRFAQWIPVTSVLCQSHGVKYETLGTSKVPIVNQKRLDPCLCAHMCRYRSCRVAEVNGGVRPRSTR